MKARKGKPAMVCECGAKLYRRRKGQRILDAMQEQHDSHAKGCSRRPMIVREIRRWRSDLTIAAGAATRLAFTADTEAEAKRWQGIEVELARQLS